MQSGPIRRTHIAVHQVHLVRTVGLGSRSPTELMQISSIHSKYGCNDPASHDRQSDCSFERHSGYIYSSLLDSWVAIEDVHVLMFHSHRLEKKGRMWGTDKWGRMSYDAKMQKEVHRQPLPPHPYADSDVTVDHNSSFS